MVSRKKRFLQVLCWLLFIGWAVITFTLSQQDGVSSEQVSLRATSFTVRVLSVLGINPNIPGLYMKLRKLAHLFVHFVLALLAGFAFATTLQNLFKAIFVAFFTTAIIALIDELVQISVSGRVFQTRDILINLTGVTLGIIGAAGIAKICKILFKPKPT